MQDAETARPGCTSARYRRVVRVPLSSALRDPGATPVTRLHAPPLLRALAVMQRCRPTMA